MERGLLQDFETQATGRHPFFLRTSVQKLTTRLTAMVAPLAYDNSHGPPGQSFATGPENKEVKSQRKEGKGVHLSVKYV